MDKSSICSVHRQLLLAIHSRLCAQWMANSCLHGHGC